MLLRFTGQYTGGRTSITIGGFVFEGREPTEVPDDCALKTHPEFEALEAPKTRGRKKKVTT